MSEQPVLPNCSLEDILSKKIQKLTDIEKILEMLKGHSIDSCDAYTAFNPLIRLRGTLLKMHVLKLTKYPRLIYLNPIEGVLITYKTANKFPHQPHNIMSLNQITTLEFMLETKWYFSRGCYYIKIATKSDRVTNTATAKRMTLSAA